MGDGQSDGARVLIIALGRALATVPTSRDELGERANLVRSILARLAMLGLDGESLVRYGMAPLAAIPLLAKLLGRKDDLVVDLGTWRSLLSIPASVLDADADAAVDVIATSLSSIDSWVAGAPFADVLTFRPPEPSALNSYVLDNQSRAAVSLPYTWLWLRSSQEDLERWPTDALHMEYRWRNELQETPFPEVALTHEGPDLRVLNEQIAYRTVVGGAKGHGSPDEELFWQLQDTAISFLRQKRYEEAAALFDFHSRHHPHDSRSLNNLSFCKLPTDPATSLDLLRRAESAGYSPLLINVYNQCCCLIRLNRLPEALDRAEYFWQRERQPDEIRSGYIWVEQDHGWELVSHDLIDQALASLIAEAAEVLGAHERSQRWAQRADQLTEAVASTATSTTASET